MFVSVNSIKEDGMNKKWYHSRTLYANIIGIVVILVTAFGYENVSAELLAIEGSILAVINFALRLITNQGLGK